MSSLFKDLNDKAELSTQVLKDLQEEFGVSDKDKEILEKCISVINNNPTIDSLRDCIVVMHDMINLIYKKNEENPTRNKV